MSGLGVLAAQAGYLPRICSIYLLDTFWFCLSLHVSICAVKGATVAEITFGNLRISLIWPLVIFG